MQPPPRDDNGRMLWIGSDGRDPFTDSQVAFLVNTASSIVIAQFHAGFDIDAHHELARRIKALDPTVRVFGYMSGTYIKPAFEWTPTTYPDDWILRDRAAEPIVHKFREDGTVSAYFADLSNPDYRAWVSGVASGWMDIAPYDGIIFDACNYLHDRVQRTFLEAVPPHPRESTTFDTMLTQQKMDEVNAGLEALFTETKAALGDKLVAWNGFWRRTHTIDRSLSLIPLGDIAVAERWSIFRPTDPAQFYHDVLTRGEILEDLVIVQQGLRAGKSFFLKDTFDEDWYLGADPMAVSRLARFGWAMYMMIREAGRSSYAISPGARFSLNDADPILLDPVAFGSPQGDFVELGRVLSRSFENGVVYMNPNLGPLDVTVDRSLTLLHGEGISATVDMGEVISIPPLDGAFFMAR